MDCSSCEHSNRDSARYCVHCGTPLYALCPRCSASAYEGDVYCGGCGVRLPAGTQPRFAGESAEEQRDTARGGDRQEGRGPSRQVVPAGESERRTVTILFADIAGFTSLSEKLDPEDVTTLMNGCLKMLADIVVRYEGYVDKFIGDCVMAVFGAPIAHENHPELAVRTALTMRQEMERFNERLPVKIDKDLALHIGINSGLVIAGNVGSDAKRNYTVMGDAVNLAARLESIAKDGQIFVSGYTWNLTRTLFEFNELEPIPVKGKRDPVAVYEVLKEKPDAGDRKSSTVVPLVGRSKEMVQLKSCAEHLLDGIGQVVMLVSEPGIGKSRTHLELKAQFKPGEVLVLEGVCRSFSRSTSYYVFVELLKSLLSVDPDDASEAIAEKVASNLPELLGEDPGRTETKKTIALIAHLLGVEPQQEGILPSDAQELKIATFSAIGHCLMRICRQEPLMIAIENVHYADPTSVELISYLFEVTRKAPIMLVLLMRPVKDHPSVKLAPVGRRMLDDAFTEIIFHRLSDADCDEFVRTMLQARSVPEEVLRMISSRAEGNPLYLEEIARGLGDEKVIERDANGDIRVLRDLKSVNIPGSIQGIVMGRIDKLPQNLKDVLQVAATIGPVFRYELIRRIFKSKNVEQRLNQLCDLEILFESRTFPEIEYSFRNVLVQEAVYSTMLNKKARELHQAVAQTIEALDGDRLDSLSETLAHHWLLGGDNPRAMAYLVSGGMRAKAAFANDEAAVQLHQALELAEQAKGKVNIDLAAVWQALSEVLDLSGDLTGARNAAEKLAAQTQNKVAKADAIRQIGRLCEKMGDRSGAALQYGEALDLLSDSQQTPEYAKILLNQSWLSSREKDFNGAIARATQALGIFTAAGLNDQIALTYNNLGVFYEGLGDVDKALDYNRRSLALFDELGDRRQIGNLHLSLGFVLSKRKEWTEALEHFDKAQETMQRIGNRIGAATVLGNRATCLTALGRIAEAEGSLRQALQAARDLDLPRRVVAAEIALAEHLARHGDPGEARKLAETALTSADSLELKQDRGRAEHLLSLLAAPSA